MTFQEIARPLVERGLPFIPLLPHSKIAFLENWPDKSLHTLQDAEQYPQDCNAAVVAKAQPGGICIFDIDAFEVLQRIKAETGRKVPETYTVETSPRSYQLYYLHTDCSIELSIKFGNLKAKTAEGKEAWSLRANNAYGVSEGSVHPDTKRPYKLLSNRPIVPIEGYLLDWILANSTKMKERVAAGFYDGQLIVEGDRNETLFKYGCALRALKEGFSEEYISTTLRDIASGSCSPAMSDKEAENVIRQVLKKDSGGGKDVVFLDGKPMGLENMVIYNAPYSLPAEVTTTSPASVDVIGTPAEVASKLDTREVAARPPFPYWVMEGTTLYEGLVKPAVELAPKYPEFIFLPAVQVILNHLSGRVYIHLQKTKLNIFLGLISPAGQFFKSSSVELAHKYAEEAGTAAPLDAQQSDGKVLIGQAGSTEGWGKKLFRKNAKHGILYFDELGKQVAKAGIQASSFGQDLLTFHGAGEFGNSVKSDTDCFSFPAGSYTFSWIWCTTTVGFDRHWPKLADIASGLDDRMFFCVSPQERKPIGTNYSDPDFSLGVAGTRAALSKAISKGRYCYDKSSVSIFEGLEPRSLELAYAFALYFAIDLMREEIDADCLRRAKAVVDYRDRVREFVAPLEAANEFARMQMEIAREVQRNCGKVSYRQLCRNLHSNRYGTSQWKAGYQGLIQEGKLIEWWEKSADGVRKTRMVGLVRDEEEDGNQ